MIKYQHRLFNCYAIGQNDFVVNEKVLRKKSSHIVTLKGKKFGKNSEIKMKKRVL